MTDLVDQPGWIYIAMDANHPERCKIGFTKRALYDRVTETCNPDYMIVKGYQVPPEEARALEKHMHKEVGKVAGRAIHLIKGKQSEVFYCAPKEAALAMEHDLAKCLGRQDEDGNPDLAAITFKPILNDGNLMRLAERVYNEEQFNNIVKAIEES